MNHKKLCWSQHQADCALLPIINPTNTRRLSKKRKTSTTAAEPVSNQRKLLLRDPIESRVRSLSVKIQQSQIKMG
jgi:hypothetical protein